MKGILKKAAALICSLALLGSTAQVRAADRVTGDVNGDGAFTLTDVITFQKWLTAVPGTVLADREAADLYADGRLNILDLCMMKTALFEQLRTALQTMTKEEARELFKRADTLTWEDFRGFAGEPAGSGLYIMEYPIEGSDSVFFRVGGGSMEGEPLYIELVDTDHDFSMDIRSDEFKAYMEELSVHLARFGAVSYTQEDAEAAGTVGAYALGMLKDGAYTADTWITRTECGELMSEEMADLFSDYNYGLFCSLSFLDEHTVIITLDAGLQIVYGYLVTDGTVTYETGGTVSVPGRGYDGDVVTIDTADGNVYFFHAGL